MNLLQIPLALVLFAQTPSPAELPSPPAAIPLQPAPAAVVPEAPASPPQLESISPAFPARPQAPAQTGESVETPEQEATPRSQNAGPQPSSSKPADSAVVQAAAQQEAAVASLPQKLWQTAIEQVDAAAFDAEPRSLLNTLRAFGDTASQTEAVKAYWRLSGAIVKLSFAEEEAAVLGQAREPQLPHEKAILAAALATALARQQECQLAVTLAQHDLAERSVGPPAMAWPTDAPLMAAYRTNFEALFANRSAPAALVKIHKTLPTVLASLEGHAAAVAAHREAVQQMSQAYAGGQVALKELLETVGDWREERTAFVQGVLRYNEQIADYALAVVYPGTDPTTVVSTLIDVKQTPQPPRPAGEVRQTAASESATSEAPPAVTFGGVAPDDQPRTSGTAPGIPPRTQSVLSGVRVAHEPQ